MKKYITGYNQFLPGNVIGVNERKSDMKAYSIYVAFISLSILTVSCTTDSPEPKTPGPDPIAVVKFLGRDSIVEGNYRGIAIHSSSDDAFTILEDYRNKNMVSYLGAVNTFFSDIADIKSRLHLFEWLVLDEKFDTQSGVQLQLESGRLKSITLNSGKALARWPETAGSSEAVQTGDPADVLYVKLLKLSKQVDWSKKFERIVLLNRYTYALYDPKLAAMPWRFIYNPQSPDTTEQVTMFFKGKKLDYVLVDHFARR